MADALILGVDGGIYQPDAIENFGASNSVESSVRFDLISPTQHPGGPEGEVVARRAHLEGYHRARVRAWFTPIVDGRFRNDLRTFVQIPAPPTGRTARFSLLIPLSVVHPDYPTITIGLRGTSFAAAIDFEDPEARFDLEGVVWSLDPVSALRARKPTE